MLSCVQLLPTANVMKMAAVTRMFLAQVELPKPALCLLPGDAFGRHTVDRRLLTSGHIGQPNSNLEAETHQLLHRVGQRVGGEGAGSRRSATVTADTDLRTLMLT
jgi:hypothetical protein